MDRRDFLKAGLGGVSGVVIGGLSAAYYFEQQETETEDGFNYSDIDVENNNSQVSEEGESYEVSTEPETTPTREPTASDRDSQEWIVGVSGTDKPEKPETELIREQPYVQQWDEQKHKFTLEWGYYLQNYYKSRPRQHQWSRYVRDPWDSDIMQTAGQHFEEITESTVETVSAAAQWVQSMEYTTDEIGAGTNQYSYYPVEMLAEQGGDCEDSCILLAAVLDALNIGTAMLTFDRNQHVALGILGAPDLGYSSYEAEGDHYYYIETTAPGWRVGEIPSQVEGETPEVHPIEPVPIVNFEWFVESGPELFSTVISQSQAVARNVELRIHIETRSGIVDTTSIQFGDVAPQNEVERSTAIDVTDEETRLSMYLDVNGFTRAKDQSEWVEPS